MMGGGGHDGNDIEEGLLDKKPSNNRKNKGAGAGKKKQ